MNHILPYILVKYKICGCVPWDIRYKFGISTTLIDCYEILWPGLMLSVNILLCPFCEQNALFNLIHIYFMFIFETQLHQRYHKSNKPTTAATTAVTNQLLYIVWRTYIKIYQVVNKANLLKAVFYSWVIFSFHLIYMLMKI